MADTADGPTEKFACLVRTRAHPGRGDDLVKGYAPVFDQVSGEDGTELFVLSRAVDDPDTFFCFEIFASRADFDEHRAKALAGESLDALNAATAEREYVWGVPVWSKG
ncbi:antibiotic biosynthesis monooxygenase family protein [Dactylosporangium sp. AC04546]|uniref:putative quinol monooxygenase n=1 Tax=Dactylosporangium sp. AC04546 TaxID=2862460 RepID=UPI001EDDC92E|nr:antibiotic biosynthesis monooxygenase family protein [Dactylosporangium sp. AC04546]WVK86925.1 antibiotic biosynthesis monooxygenase family protein [Dactylosporangium sp. AC04546]